MAAAQANGGSDAAFANFTPAVRIALDPTVAATQPSVRQEAEVYLANLRAHPNIWPFCVSVLQKAPVAATETFWCFSALLELIAKGHYAGFDDASKASFEGVLMKWAGEVCMTLEPGSQFVTNKFAQLLVTTFVASGYPKRWTSFFEEIFNLLPKGPQMIYLYLRVLESIDVLIVEPLRDIRDQAAHQRNTIIKDTIRLQSFPQISNTWFHIISQHHQTRPEIARQCMQVISPYFAWIDINQVSTEDWINMFYFFVGSPELREEGIKCLMELCEKKMADPAAKLQLLRNLRVADCMPGMVSAILKEYGQLLCESTDEYLEDSEGGGFVSRVADLAITVGLELIDIVGNLMANNAPSVVLDTAKSMLAGAIPMQFDLLACGHPGISKKVCEFSIRKYVETLKRHPDLPRTHLPRILTIVGDRLALNPNLYNFAVAGDYEAVVDALRKQLYIVFKNISTLERDLAVEFMASRIHAVLNALARNSLAWPHADAALRLLYVFGEELGTSKTMLMKNVEGPFHKLVSDIFQSGMAMKLQHHELGVTFLEVLERYYQFFIHTPNTRPLLLQLTLGPGGAGHPHPRVREKACSVFCSLSKLLKNVLLACVEEVVRTVQGLLTTDTLNAHDRCALFETVGVLIAYQDDQLLRPHQYLKPMAQPLFDTLRGTLQAPSEAHLLTVANTVMYMGHLSKGFSRLTSPTSNKLQPEVAALWQEACEIVVKANELYAHVVPVREKVLMFAHRMIDLLGTGSTPYMRPLMAHIVRHCELGDLPKVIRIPTQLLQRLKGSAVDEVDAYFLPLIQKTFSITDTVWLEKISSMHTEQGREHIELLRAYFGLLVQAAQPDCIRLFLTDGSRPVLDTVLETLKKGCLSPPEMEIAKYCYQVMLKMAQSWYTTLPGFPDFLASQVIPMTVYTVKLPHYNPNDAKCNAVAGEIANLCLFLCSSAGPDAFMACFTSAWQLAPEQQQRAVQAFASGQPKQVKALIRELAAAAKAGRR